MHNQLALIAFAKGGIPAIAEGGSYKVTSNHVRELACYCSEYKFFYILLLLVSKLALLAVLGNFALIISLIHFVA